MINHRLLYMPVPFKPSSTPSTEKAHLSKNLSSTQIKRLVFSHDAIAVRYLWGFFFGLVLFALFSCVPIIIALSDFQAMALPFLIFGSILELIALSCLIYCLFNTLNLPVFDTLNGMFYPKGRRHAELAVQTKNIDHLQILEIEMHSCYELNVVMKDGNRFNITAHGEYSKFMADAKQLAESLALFIKDIHGEPYVEPPADSMKPLVPEGPNFQTTHLVFRQDSIRVQATWKFFLFFMIFVLISLAMIMGGLFLEQTIIWPLLIFGVCFSTIILWAFFHCLKKQSAPLFDIVDGMFYPKGFTRDGSGIPLRQLNHLQIIKERVYRRNNAYDSYELNVVLKDGSRYNIMDHGNEKRLLADAHALAARLSFPLVDAQAGQPVTMPKDKNAKVDSTIVNSAPASIGGTIFLLIFGMIFFSAGGFCAWMLCIKPMSGVIASGGWTPTPAQIIDSQLVRSHSSNGSSTYRIDIQYQYNINGSRHVSNRYDFFRSSMHSNVGVGAMREIIESLPSGTETSCLVNPANPDEAVISRSVPWFNALFMVFPLPFLFIGGITIVAVFKSFFKPKTKS